MIHLLLWLDPEKKGVGRGFGEEASKTIESADRMEAWRFGVMALLVILALLTLPRMISAWRGTTLKETSKALAKVQKNQGAIIRALRKKGLL